MTLSVRHPANAHIRTSVVDEVLYIRAYYWLDLSLHTFVFAFGVSLGVVGILHVILIFVPMSFLLAMTGVFLILATWRVEEIIVDKVEGVLMTRQRLCCMTTTTSMRLGDIEGCCLDIIDNDVVPSDQSAGQRCAAVLLMSNGAPKYLFQYEGWWEFCAVPQPSVCCFDFVKHHQAAVDELNRFLGFAPSENSGEPTDYSSMTVSIESDPISDLELQSMAPQDLCVVCLSRPKTHAFTSCFHKCVCGGCALDIKKERRRRCPLCRKVSANIRRVFE